MGSLLNPSPLQARSILQTAMSSSKGTHLLSNDAWGITEIQWLKGHSRLPKPFNCSKGCNQGYSLALQARVDVLAYLKIAIYQHERLGKWNSRCLEDPRGQVTHSDLQD